MSYNKRTWANGNVVGAVDLNRMEQGVESGQNGYECIQSEVILTSEEISTSTEGDYQIGYLSYTSLIDAETLIVYFDGVRYECQRSDSSSSAYQYGGVGKDEYDFSTYPFAISSEIQIEVAEYRNAVYCDTAGVHTIELKTISEVVNTTECFEKAVKSVAKGGKAFTDVAGGTCDNNTYTEYNITYNDFINARNNGTNIVYALIDADELQAGNIVAFNCIERSGWYEVQAIYAQVTEGAPFPTVDWMPLTLFCDTTDGYMRDANCWEQPT